jgi:glycerophosphodiester phosphodiesterase
VLQPREARDILAGFLEARDAIHKLQWFCKVNRDGFVCLLRKLEDCPPCAEKPNLDDYSFASPSACADFLRQICHSIRFISRPCNEEIGGKFHDDRKKPEHSYLTNGLPHTRDLTCAIAENDVSALIVALKDYNSISPLYRQELRFARLAALHVSVMSGSRDCISHLLQRLDTIRNDKTASKQNCIHRLVIAMGRLSTLSARYPKTENFEIACSLPRELEDSLSLLVFLLDKLLSDQRSALLNKDHFGRIPLHYAAQYGLKDACEVMVDRMQKWKLLTDEEEQSSMLIDIEGYTPLHLGVFEEHTDVLTSLLRLQVQSPTINSIDGPREASSNLLAALLISAVESGSVDIVKILLSNCHTYTGYTQQRGETALFCAARRGNLEVVKLLIEAHRAQGVILDLPEQAFGWTPLIVACVNNHVQIVEALLQAGANAKHQDVYQWTAKDHAAFRARWEVEKLLPPSTLETTTRVLKRSPAELAAITPCLRDESKIIVHLGTLNTRAQEPAVDLNLHHHTDNNFRHQHAKSSSGLKYPYAGYSVEIKARGACGSSHEISLPVLEDATNFPTIFTAKDPSAVQLLFIFYDNFGKEKVHIGTAIALLKNLKDGLGINLESFSRNYTIPIHDGFMDFIGTVTFNFLVVKPFDHPNSIFTTPQEIWTLGEPTHIVGHRGNITLTIFPQCTDFVRIRSEQSILQTTSNWRKYHPGKFTVRASVPTADGQ